MIVDGQPAMLNVWPWQLAIETDNRTHFNLHCGGVVISPNWGLTAAHCVTPRPGGDSILSIAGMYNRSQSLINTQIRILTPGFITLHPQFNPFTLLNDIAILNFSPPLDLSTPRVRAACLPPSSSVSYIENPNCYITGWGLTSQGGQLAESLQRISTDVLRPLHCALRMDNRTQLDSETCTFDQVSRSQTPCHGDMGGPLSCVVNAQFYVAGVGSFVDDNCDPTVGQIFTNVPFFVDWIRSVTGLLPV